MMASTASPKGEAVVLRSLGPLADALRTAGRVFAPAWRDDRVTIAQLADDEGFPEDLPLSVAPRPAGERMLTADWKALLYPPRQHLWSAIRTEEGFTLREAPNDWPVTVFLGMRACEVSALTVLDRVFAADPFYSRRRRDTLIVAIHCAGAASTCFCASTGTGPRVSDGFDLSLTPIEDGFLLEAGSDQGQAIAQGLDSRAATAADHAAARALSASVAAAQTRRMPEGIADTLRCAPEHPHWDHVAARCLGCGACALSCPTCFCADIEDSTDIAGEQAERWRVWSSCYDIDFSLVGAGPVRRSIKSRYRQWLTHKLSSWVDQFGVSGCVGCGRCIAACPVGIDLTAEAAALSGEEADAVA
jgi:ferredoxin